MYCASSSNIIEQTEDAYAIYHSCCDGLPATAFLATEVLLLPCSWYDKHRYRHRRLSIPAPIHLHGYRIVVPSCTNYTDFLRATCKVADGFIDTVQNAWNHTIVCSVYTDGVGTRFNEQGGCAPVRAVKVYASAGDLTRTMNEQRVHFRLNPVTCISKGTCTRP